MKYLLCTLFLLSVCLSSQAQDDDTSSIPLEERKNEVRLNGLYLVVGAFEGSYSHILNEESSVGVTVFLPFDDEIRDDINYYISTYYRFFFGKKHAGGFFLEGFGMLNSYVEEEFFGFDVPTVEENITDFALGIGLGGKFMTKRGLVGEVNLGIGRNLFNSKSNDFGNEIVGKVGISIGYRF